MTNPLKIKLSAFKRKYFLHRLWRGVLLFVSLGLGFWVLVSGLEYFFYLPSGFRAVLFFSLLLLEGWVTWKYLVVPGLSLLRMDQVMTDEEAARLIGTFFPEIEDKLLNTLQLSHSGHADPLILASIEQRTHALRPFDFKRGINFKAHRHLFYWATPVLVVLMILWVSGNESVLTSGTQRIVRFNDEFQRPNPYSIEILNEDLEGVSGRDMVLKFRVNGPDRPERVSLTLDGYDIPVSNSSGSYIHRFKSLYGSLEFFITTNGYRNGLFTIHTYPKGELTHYQLKVIPPSYTRLQTTIWNDPGDFDFPSGSRLEWELATRNADAVVLRFPKDTLRGSASNGSTKFTTTRSTGFTYESVVINERFNEVAFRFQGNVIPDRFPKIHVEMIADSLREGLYFFRGLADDDYGVKNLTGFLLDGEDQARIDLKASGEHPISFSSVVDIRDKGTGPFEVYFLVTDNDQVNGSKSVKSQRFRLESLDEKKVEQRSEELGKSISNEVKELTRDVKQQNQNISRINEAQSRNKSDFEERNELKDRLERQEELRERLEGIKKDLEEKHKYDEENKALDKDLLKKQEEIKDLAKKMDDSKSRDLMKRIEELMKDLDKDQARDVMREMEMENQLLMDQLKQLEQLLKQLEMEKDLRDQVRDLDQMSKELDKMSQEEQADEQDRQKDLNKRFDDWKKKQEEVEKDAKDFALDDMPDQEEQDATSEDLDQASEDLSKQKQGPASKSQSSASQKMKKMKEKLSNSLSMMSGAMQEKNLEDVTRLLDNLVVLSFQQEELIDKFSYTQVGSVRYGSLIREQKRIEEGFELLKDSLQALANRTPMIEPVITREVNTIRLEIDRSIEHFTEGQVDHAQTSQWMALTGANNLALMLSNAMDQMQQQMANQMKGNQNCQKPGAGKPGSQSNERAKQLQQQLQGKIQQFMKGKGKAPKPGKEGTSGSPNSSEIYEMMKMQEELRNSLEKGEKGSNGNSDSEWLDEIEKKIANGEIDQELLERVKEIETRLLEAETAEREQRMKEDRESNSSDEPMRSGSTLPSSRQPQGRLEKLQLQPLELNPFYQKKIIY